MSFIDNVAVSAERLADIIESDPEPLICFSLDGSLLYRNRAAKTLLGPGVLSARLDHQAEQSLLKNVRRAARCSIPCKFRLDINGRGIFMRAWRTRPDKPDVPALVVVSGTAANTLLPRNRLLAGRLHDTEQERDRALLRAKQLNEEAAHLKRLAAMDRLTGVMNVGAFQETMERLGTRQGCLFLLDLDRFKQVNDTHGHAVGDALLRHVAQALTSNMRSGDLVARIGGDEFVFWAEGIGAGLVQDFAARITDALRAPCVCDHGDEVVTLTVQASIGCAVSPPLISVEELMAEADADMYRQKTRLKGA